MAAKEELNCSQIFAEITKYYRTGDFTSAQKSCNKILKVFPNDVEAIKCKVVCLIQQCCFKEAKDVILSAEKKNIVKFPFQKAYCLYRLNNLLEAKNILEGISELGVKEKELLAQVHYRLEKYSECLQLYRNLIKNSADEFGDEREANMVAVIAAAKMWNDTNLDDFQKRLDTYELCYNYACLLLAQGEFVEAKKLLSDALNMCIKSFDGEEDVSAEEMEEETGVIKAQIGYINQLQGKTKEALNLYTAVLKKKPTDAALYAIMSNNIISVHKERDLFDSKKRLKALSADGLQNKLTKVQLRTMEVNKCILYMHTNQMDNCRNSIRRLKTQFNETAKNDDTALLEAAVFLKDKHGDQAFDYLRSIIESGVKSNDIILTLAQLLLQKGKMEEALSTLKHLSVINYSPAVVSLCVGLHNALGQRSEALKHLDEAVKYGRDNVECSKHSVTFMRKSSNLKLASGDIKSALVTLEQLQAEVPDDVAILAKIVTAYSKIDLKKAQHYSTNLPQVSDDYEKIDLNALEMTDFIGSFRFSKKQLKQSAEEGDVKKDYVVTKKKRRKRKKGKLPKSYDPGVDPDPERWLPRWERSTFKHKKSKRANNNINKGTQGSVASEQPASPKPITTPSSPPSATSVLPPRQQKPNAKSKGKKKKGKNW